MEKINDLKLVEKADFRFIDPLLSKGKYQDFLGYQMIKKIVKKRAKKGEHFKAKQIEKIFPFLKVLATHCAQFSSFSFGSVIANQK